MEIPNDAYTTLSRNLIGGSTLSQEYCKLIGWYWKIMRRQLWTLTNPIPYDHWFIGLQSSWNVYWMFCVLWWFCQYPILLNITHMRYIIHTIHLTTNKIFPQIYQSSPSANHFQMTSAVLIAIIASNMLTHKEFSCREHKDIIHEHVYQQWAYCHLQINIRLILSFSVMYWLEWQRIQYSSSAISLTSASMLI